MNNSNKRIQEIYQDLSQWLDEVKNNELQDALKVLSKAKEIALAAEAMSEEKVKQFLVNLRYDLKEFYHLNQQQADNSLYLGLMNESMWRTLAKVTDQTQVEWSELIEDFEHDGIYTAGDVIGFGEVICQNCHQTQHISHPMTLAACPSCQGEDFVRVSYAES